MVNTEYVVRTDTQYVARSSKKAEVLDPQDPLWLTTGSEAVDLAYHRDSRRETSTDCCCI